MIPAGMQLCRRCRGEKVVHYPHEQFGVYTASCPDCDGSGLEEFDCADNGCPGYEHWHDTDGEIIRPSQLSTEEIEPDDPDYMPWYDKPTLTQEESDWQVRYAGGDPNTTYP